MRSNCIIFYESEIVELFKELNVSEKAMELFLNAFDNPADWIHVFVEWLKDQEAEKKL